MCRSDEWAEAQSGGTYSGSSQDVADGFIHFSTAEQIRVSAAKHRAGQTGLVLLWVDPSRLSGGTLKWEESRNSMLFPHLYGALNTGAAVRTDPLELGPDGNHVFPLDFPTNEAE
ncbi:MAG: DUF952 domain-containing protein [Rhodospirillales bacterium]|nr:DUF952 domain-containing protein [Rhodospirillales bacterium]MBT4628060.1 DUF952 domain-containing protein [Rhodospirillales bacterium]MBT5353231.1 DUF952 domain-containing protein [Rhodospirillales bacterium]MBT5522428.1 DUF952 domain-containing protein [Rhodospirillales bacterium]MBT6108929.1 DUF952 domain-containing protein [Rhodospirillales bacterium]